MIKNFIPTINISSIIKKNQDKKKIYLTIKKIEKACIDVGFFQIIGHGIDQKQIKNICKVGNKFFNLSNKSKKKLSPKKLSEIYRKNKIRKKKIRRTKILTPVSYTHLTLPTILLV